LLTSCSIISKAFTVQSTNTNRERERERERFRGGGRAPGIVRKTKALRGNLLYYLTSSSNSAFWVFQVPLFSASLILKQWTLSICRDIID